MTKEEIKQLQKRCEAYRQDLFKVKKELALLKGEHLLLNGKIVQSENERLKAEREWISVEDRLPEVFEHVLIYTINGRITTANITSYHHWNTDQPEPLSMRQVTHWMPLPKPPKQ